VLICATVSELPWKLCCRVPHGNIVFKINQPLVLRETAMKTTATLINIMAFAALFFDYAVAMTPPEPAGTRRFLQIYAGQLPTGTFPTRKVVWEIGYSHTDMV